MQRKFRLSYFYIVISVLAISSIIFSLSIGSERISLSDTFKIMSNHLFWMSFEPSWKQSTEFIVWDIRAPRVFLAFSVGAALSLAGAAFQGLLRNPLADPFTLGVSSGASLGAVISISFHLSIAALGIFNLSFFALLGALLSLFLVFSLARLGNHMRIETLILSGIIISSFLSAFISLMIALSDKELMQIIYWLMGSVAMRDWGHVIGLIPIVIICFVLLLWKSRELNILSFGEDTGRYLGISIERSRTFILFVASLLTAAAVAVSGVVGFVGLVIPHFVRILIGPNHVHLLPVSMLSGGIFLTLSDTIARTIISPSELPLGVITALIGAPVFAILVYKRDASGKLGGMK